MFDYRPAIHLLFLFLFIRAALGWRCFRFFHQFYYKLDSMRCIAQACLHCRSHFQAFVNTAKVVVNEIQGKHVNVVINLLAEAVCQSGEAAHAHTHCEVLALDV